MPIRTRRHAKERLLVLTGLGVASAFCVAFEIVRELYFEQPGYRFLLWNLVLAWVPLVLALLVYDRYRAGTRLERLVPAVALWLLFMPNAPYILTDFIHLRPTSHTPLWFDAAVLSAFAWTGLLLGFASLYLQHTVFRDRFGARAGWLGVAGVLAVTSAGMYLGRFLRWNSWDLLVRPGKRLTQLAPHLADPVAVARASALTLLLTLLLGGAYVVFCSLFGARLEPDRGPSSQPRS